MMAEDNLSTRERDKGEWGGPHLATQYYRGLKKGEKGREVTIGEGE